MAFEFSRAHAADQEDLKVKIPISLRVARSFQNEGEIEFGPRAMSACKENETCGLGKNNRKH